MARVTVASLVAQLEAAHAAYERLAAQHEALRAECNAFQGYLVTALAERDALRAKQPRAYVPVAAPTDRRAAMAAARERAMSTGCVVKAW